MSQPRILVARAIFPDIVDRLREHFDVEANPDDVIWTPAELTHFVRFWSEVLAPATMWVSTSRRTALIPSGSLIPSWPSTM